MRRESVTAQQQFVSPLQLDGDRLGARRSTLARAERSRDDVLMLMRMCFLSGYLPDLDQPLNERVILRDLAERRAFHQVSSAVADPRDCGVGRCDNCADPGRTHSSRLRMARD